VTNNRILVMILIL